MTHERTQHYNYFNLKSFTSDLMLEFESLKELIRYFESQNVKTVYRVRKSETEVDGFGMPSKGGFFYHGSMGFRSLEDFNSSQKHGFPDAETFYLAQRAGYRHFDDYSLACTNGITEKSDFDELVSGGFREGFADYEEARKKGEWKWIPDGIRNPAELFTHAKTNGFTTYTDMATACSLGFQTMAEYDIAIEKGFANAADYAEGKEKDFDTGEELAFARKHNLRNRDDAKKFLNLEEAGEEGLAHDAKVLLILLSKLPQAKKVSINKLADKFFEEMEAMKDADTGTLPAWFTLQLQEGKPALVNFLKKDAVKNYGLYDTDGEFFETVSLQSRKLVIDGSNVAFATKKATEKKPKVANLLLVVEALKKKGIHDITVIADASLRHRLLDKDELPRLEELCTYLEAPAEKSADVFIIQMVKREHCLLMSNDTFREWKVADPWIAENIDYYRVAFLIEGTNVILPDFDI